MFLVYFCYAVLMALALFERPAVPGLRLPYWATVIVEFACVTFFIFRFCHEMCFTKFKSFWKDTKVIFVAILFQLIFNFELLRGRYYSEIHLKIKICMLCEVYVLPSWRFRHCNKIFISIMSPEVLLCKLNINVKKYAKINLGIHSKKHVTSAVILMLTLIDIITYTIVVETSTSGVVISLHTFPFSSFMLKDVVFIQR